MKSDTHRYLDGEIPRDALSPEQLQEAAALEEALDVAGLRRLRAPADLDARILRALPESQPGRTAERRARETGAEASTPHTVDVLARAWRWLTQPREVRVRPLTAGLATAALAILLLVARGGEIASGPGARDGGGATGPDAAPVTTVAEGTTGTAIYVRFTFSAPDARSVAVAGDFNAWSTGAHTLRDPDGDGVWTATLPLAPGVHEYMFVVDEERWVTDPDAEEYVSDGFGMRNALVTVAPPRARRSS